MDYASIITDLLKKKKTKYTMCWIAAVSKRDFIGTGPRKLSKAEIENYNVWSICDEIEKNMALDENVCPFKSFLLQTQMTYGTLKIFSKQVIFLKEKCTEAMNSIWDHPTKKSKNKNIELDDDWYDKEIEAVDLTLLFRNPKTKKDKYLIQEFDLPINTSIDFSFDDELPTEISSIPSIAEGPTRFPEAVGGLGESVTPGQTPKRKSRTPHDETPSKRSRSSKAFRSGVRPSGSPTSGVRKSLFQQVTSQEPVAAVTCQDVQQDPHDIPQDIPDIVPGLPQEPTAYEQDIIQQGPSDDLAHMLHPGVPNITDKTVEKSVAQNPEANALLHQSMSHEISADHVVVDNIQRPSSIVQESRENEDILPLPEIDDSMINPKRRKKKRKFVVFDNKELIDINENLTNPRNVQIKSRESRIVDINFQKVPAKTLLSLPSVYQKLGTYKSKSIWSWGKTLASQFLEMIQSPCPDHREDTFAGSSPRDRGVNKRRRRTTFTIPERSTSRTTSDSTTTVKQSIHQTYINADDEPGYQEAMIMPPPPPPPEPTLEEAQLPATPQRERQTQLPRTPRLERERHLDSRVTVSPRQQGRPSGAEPPQYEPQPASESPVAVSMMDRANLPTARHSSSRTPEHSIAASSKSESIQFRDYFMSVAEFADFLEKIWTVLRIRSRYGQLKFELQDILVPSESSCEELGVYFVYLCDHARREELLIKQDELYSTVTIIRLDERF